MSGCDRVVDALAGRSALDGELAAHVARCGPCGAMVAADRELDALTVPAPSGDEALPPALRDALRRDARPVAAFSAWRRALPAAAVALAVAAVGLLARPRADLAHQPVGRMALGAGAAVAGLAVALTLLLHGGRRGLGLPASVRWIFVGSALAGFAAVSAAVSVPVEGSVHLAGAAAWLARLGCALHGTALAALVGAVLFYGARRSAAVSPAAAGAVAGLGAGLVGALAQHLQCPVMDLDHTLVAHLAPVALGALLGALAGRRWLAP
ncbi:MAG: NrsF family protein [Myxococcales bacterium]|nr:NrsF family protein [Myxococcales bacterium]